MNNTFELKKGKLVFEDDKIIISDNAAYIRRTRFLSIGILLLMAFVRVMTYFKTGDMASLLFTLVFGTIGILVLVTEFFKSVQREIPMKEVKSMKIKRSLFREYLVIKFAGNKTRVVTGIFNAERLEEYVKTLAKVNQT